MWIDFSKTKIFSLIITLVLVHWKQTVSSCHQYKKERKMAPFTLLVLEVEEDFVDLIQKCQKLTNNNRPIQVYQSTWKSAFTARFRSRTHMYTRHRSWSLQQHLYSPLQVPLPSLDQSNLERRSSNTSFSCSQDLPWPRPHPKRSRHCSSKLPQQVTWFHLLWNSLHEHCTLDSLESWSSRDDGCSRWCFKILCSKIRSSSSHPNRLSRILHKLGHLLLVENLSSSDEDGFFPCCDGQSKNQRS